MADSARELLAQTTDDSLPPTVAMSRRNVREARKRAVQDLMITHEHGGMSAKDQAAAFKKRAPRKERADAPSPPLSPSSHDTAAVEGHNNAASQVGAPMVSPSLLSSSSIPTSFAGRKRKRPSRSTPATYSSFISSQCPHVRRDTDPDGARAVVNCNCVLCNLLHGREAKHMGPRYLDVLRTITPDKIMEITKRAEENDAFAQCVLGILYEAGVCGVTQDFTKATTWLERAGERGEAEAQYRLGEFYRFGVMSREGLKGWMIALGCMRDPTSQAFWYEKAAQQGHKLAQRSLALMYSGLPIPVHHIGEVLPTDVAKARFWLQKAGAKDLLAGMQNSDRKKGAVTD